MKNFIKISVLAALLLISAIIIISCAADGGPAGNPEAPVDNSGAENAVPEEEAAPERDTPDLPDADYGGYNFKFLVREWDANGFWGTYEIYAEEETGDPINDAVFRRNRAVEEKFNINITEVRSLDVDGLTKRSVTASDDAYDCAVPGLTSAANMAGGGYLYSLDNLPHMDLSRPWWDQNANNMSIGGRLFFAIGDLLVQDKDSMFIVMFNKTVAQNSGIEDMYKLVRENKWTFDKFHSVMREVSKDLNGDGEMGFDDLLGLASSDFAINVLFYNSGETVTRKDADDFPYFTINTERAITAATRAFEIITDNSSAILANEMRGIPNPWEDGINRMFQENRALFLLAQITFIHRTRTMESDFGILPSPKLDETQDKYYSSINPVNATCVAVPSSAQETKRTSVILEALAAESRYTLVPAYYDITITNKMIRDEESAEMLDLILSSRVFDLGFIFNWGDMGMLPLSLYRNRNGDFVSNYEKIEARAASEMAKTIDAFRELD